MSDDMQVGSAVFFGDVISPSRFTSENAPLVTKTHLEVILENMQQRIAALEERLKALEGDGK